MLKTTIKTATLHDLSYLIDIAKQEGWNPGLHDAIPFYFTDPTGFFIQHLHDKPIGCISAVAYNTSYGFMGFYFVSPEYRHQGYGLKLWDHAISYLGSRAIGLDGVVAQQSNYKKSGFEYYNNNIRYSGTPQGKLNPELLRLDAIPFPLLVDYDTEIYGIDRSIFLQHWITMPDSYSLAKMVDHKLLGYGVIRKCEHGYKIGPLFAENSHIANEIFLGLVHPYQGNDIFLDIIQNNYEAHELTQQHNMTKVFETARMYKNTPPKQQIPSIFGVTTFELG